MEENSNINPEILEEARRLAQEKGFGDAMATVLMEKYQMSYIDLEPYLRIIDNEISKTEKSETAINDYIKQLIEEHGIKQQLWICKLTAEKYRLPLREAKNLFDELCGISRKKEDYFPKHLMEAHEEKESKNKEAENKSNKIAKISLILMITGISLIFATLGITNFPKAFFFVGIGLFLAAMILMIAKGNRKKR